LRAAVVSASIARSLRSARFCGFIVPLIIIEPAIMHPGCPHAEAIGENSFGAARPRLSLSATLPICQWLAF
jgi:hypothetical protein